MTDNESTTRLRLAVIVGSVRGGRLGPTVGTWFADQVAEFGGFDVDLIDLVDVPLPLEMPAVGDEPPAEVKVVSDPLKQRLRQADAFVMITPEYNKSFPASLKNLIDWHFTEWAAKPVGFVSYGGISGGLRSIEQLRLVMSELHAVTTRNTVSFHDAWGHWDHSGNWPKEPEGPDAAAKTLLVELQWWARALANARAIHAYPA